MFERDSDEKPALAIWILWILGGYFGAHRLYLGWMMTGFAMLALFVMGLVLNVAAGIAEVMFAAFVWWLIDAGILLRWTTRKR